MKAVFMSGRFFNVPAVYSEEMQKELSKELTFLTPVKSKEELAPRKDELCEVEIIFSTWGMLPLTKEEITEYFPKLRHVFYAAGTVRYFAKPFLELGISVHSAWRANGIPVAEVTVSEILLANKGFFQRRVKSRKMWTNSDPQLHYPGNYGASVGILGAGMIGSEVIRLLAPYRLSVYVYDPFLSEERATAMGVTKTSLEYIFKNCHVISNHIANLPETVGLISRPLLSSMAEDAVFINTGRAAQVDMEALIDEMRRCPLRTALLDVTDPVEPPIEDSPLYTLENVYLTPHIAGSIGNEFHRLADFMAEEYRTVLAGQPAKHEVTLKMLETMA